VNGAARELPLQLVAAVRPFQIAAVQSLRGQREIVPDRVTYPVAGLAAMFSTPSSVPPPLTLLYLPVPPVNVKLPFNTSTPVGCSSAVPP
jgi:hypothetical protein